jgi:hypothetical protein
MMEPERPKVDQAVSGFLKSEALHPADMNDPLKWWVHGTDFMRRATANLYEAGLPIHEVRVY